jgi:hypothetical protein
MFLPVILTLTNSQRGFASASDQVRISLYKIQWLQPGISFAFPDHVFGALLKSRSDSSSSSPDCSEIVAIVQCNDLGIE